MDVGDLRRKVRTAYSLVTPRTVHIDRHGFEFAWRAPIVIADRAATRGVENIISRTVHAAVGPGDTAIDVGTNFGYITCVMAHAGAEVIGVEAERRVARAANANLRRNGWRDRAQVVHGRAGRAPMLTVDSLARGRAPVRAIKIDVDGPDFDVLLGATETVERDRPLVVVEMSQNEQAIYEWLSERYEHVVDMQFDPVVPGRWPPNIFASSAPIAAPGSPAD